MLAEVNQRKKKSIVVNFRLTLEPHNVFDSRAIAIEAEIDSQWKRVGYLVSEVLKCVHEALGSSKIVRVELCWVKFITHWSRSGPGWYCGINISKKGPWSNTRSTL